MKKTIAIMISSMLLVLLAACGGGSSSGAGESNLTPESEIVIEATNFKFDQEEYRVKKDSPVKITFKNVEGNHGIIIPALKLELKGKSQSKVVVPKETGEFEIACSIMCGAGHSTMISKLIVEE
ncbi:cytochrome C oxidase subunit II [Paenibacillus woosongensis]|uniref:Cytochrome C oxidase subunit II n=1 Tax=Paenibacillus woosongensis TaxID=307580 RepID=A0A7X2YXR7_9BACL|nr:cytochrome C oxidase subunit II [Paenibacillus woosongensis]MUG43921.1 cytochrome C oxidase subunit II [Paenibacillus woosongensis]